MSEANLFLGFVNSLGQVVRSIFAISPEDSATVKIAKPAAMSILMTTAAAPLDMPWTNIRTAIMTSNVNGGITGAIKAIVTAVPKGAESATLRSGISNMYAGCLSEIGRQAIRQPTRATCLVYLPPIIKKRVPEEYHNTVPFLTGFLTALFDTFISAPLEARRQYRNSMSTATGNTTQFRPLMGIKETYARQIPSWVILSYGIESTKNVLRSTTNNKEISYKYYAFVSYPIAGTFIITMHPFDMVKAQKQQAGVSKYNITEKTGILESIRKIYEYGAMKNGAVGGIKEMWRGSAASTIQRGPAVFIMFSVTEFFSRDTPAKPLVIALGDAQSFASRIMKNFTKSGGAER